MTQITATSQPLFRARRTRRLGSFNDRYRLPPLAEQHRIILESDRRLSLIRVAEAQVTANLARAQRLRQSILPAAFTTPASAGQ